MATTIRSTQLDFFAIKNNLKKFLQEKDEFADYNFEASGLSNILDVLAYNTHYNALIANFATNEAYLNTAQLRESVVSLAASIGYVPLSKSASEATLRITLKLSVDEVENQNRPTSLTIPEFTRFKSTVDGVTYVFQNTEDLVATDNNGVYEFHPITDPDADVTVYEGDRQVKEFIAGPDVESTVFVIPDVEMDTTTAVVRVFESPASQAFTVYENLINATQVSEDSPLYILNEAPNEFYELSFGVGSTLGATPVAGNKIQVTYLRTTGAEADGAITFTPFSEIQFEEVTGSSTLSVSTISQSAGGKDKQGIESIRKNAPFQYASQNRMVTADDYTALILKNFSSFIKDIVSFGGEEVANPEFGTVFTSIVFNEGISNRTKNVTKEKIRDLADRLSIASFDLKFLDPQTTYVSTVLTFEFDPTLTGLSRSSVVQNTNQEVEAFFSETTGRFGQNFRRSNLLTRIDGLDPSILSSQCEVRVEKRIFPTLFADQSFTVKFPVALQSPKLSYATNRVSEVVISNREGSVDLPYATVYSSFFTYNNQVVQVRNSLNEEQEITVNGVGTGKFEVVPSTNLELYNLSTGEVLISSVGYFEPAEGLVVIESLLAETIVGSRNFIKIFGIPANESLIDVVLNEIITYDAEESSSRAVINQS